MTYDHDYLIRIRNMLEQPAIPESIRGKDGNDFLLTLITRDDPYEDLATEFEEQDPDCRWGIREWIAEAAIYPGFVVSVRSSGDDPAAGFVAFDTRVFIFGSDTVDSSHHISIKLEPKSVYVAPGCRGQGFGDALAELLARQVPAVLGRLASASEAGLKDMRPRISFSIEAECVSEEGARFVKKVVEASRQELAGFGPVGRWAAPDGLDDYVDFGDWGEEDELEAAFPQV